MIRLARIGRMWSAGRAVADAEVHLDGERIAFAGPAREAPRLPEAETVDCGGRLVTPGLIDAHTHPLYAGDRSAEVAQRSAGASYAAVAAAGGGILATVRATRAAPPAELAAAARRRLARWPAGGATTVEAKTGYHLERRAELGAVGLLAGLDGEPGLPRLRVTLLGAHAVPPEHPGGQAGYAREVAGWAADAAAAGAHAVDAFCDEGYFTVAECRRIALGARSAGLAVRLHADELARSGGAQLAAEVRAASADHLLRITAADADALAAAGVSAVLCPLTALGLGARPPARTLAAAGVTLALGTDHNPGTSGATSMSLVVALAVAACGLSINEALLAATAGGAASLGLADECGRVEAGRSADVVLWEAAHEGALAWGFGLPARAVWVRGRRVR